MAVGSHTAIFSRMIIDMYLVPNCYNIYKLWTMIPNIKIDDNTQYLKTILSII